jgi:hypothetical protein
MATYKKTKRKLRRKKAARKRRQCLDHAPPTARHDFTIAEWCARRRVSRGTFYKLKRLGLAPKSLKFAKCRRITHEADQQWEQERLAASEAP